MNCIHSKNINIDSCLLRAHSLTEETKKQKSISIELSNLNSYDSDTYIHSINVCVLSVLVGLVLDLTDPKLRNLSQAALLHDIGKICLPLDLLNKPGKLTEEEFTKIQKHPLYGYNLLKRNNCFSPIVKKSILSHHENEDGTGYPQNLTSDKIPTSAKIIHVADVYDALTAKRVYKDALTSAQALEYLTANSGTMFDKHITDTFIYIIQLKQ